MSSQALQTTVYSATDALRTGVLTLQRARIESASLDARLLLEFVLGVSREQLLDSDRLPLTPQQEEQYRELIESRARHCPVSQLIERREFWGMMFKVTSATLDPRPDSETLVEAVLERRPDRQAPLSILDLGTGTGCLLLALLKEFPQARGTGVDISEEALAVARDNAARHGMEERCRFVHSCWDAAVEERFDLIIANPPYIPTRAIANLAPEVRLYEPSGALDGGEDGLDCYRAIMPRLPRLLAEGGLAAFEIGIWQKSAVEALMTESGLRLSGVKKDLAGVQRCMLAEIHHS